MATGAKTASPTSHRARWSRAVSSGWTCTYLLKPCCSAFVSFHLQRLLLDPDPLIDERTLSHVGIIDLIISVGLPAIKTQTRLTSAHATVTTLRRFSAVMADAYISE